MATFTLAGVVRDFQGKPRAGATLGIRARPGVITDDEAVYIDPVPPVEVGRDGSVSVDLVAHPGVSYDVEVVGVANTKVLVPPQEPGAVVAYKDLVPVLVESPLSPYVRGASAYEVWLSLGNEGTVEDWEESLRGPANTLAVGTVTTTAPGTDADAEITGEAPSQTLNLFIPRGDKGEQGEQGIQGIQGETGPQGEVGPTGSGTSVTLNDDGTVTIEGGQEVSATVVGLTTGKNLFNPDAVTEGYYLNHGTGALVEFANYFTSDFIPVAADQPYTTVARKLVLFDDDGGYVSGLDLSQATGPTTFTPAMNGYARFSINTASTGGTGPFQFEAGDAATAWEPYQVRLPDGVMTTVLTEIAGTPSGPVALTRSGAGITVTSDVDGAPLAISASIESGRNGLFNFGNVVHGVTTVATPNDDVAPIRTQIGTLGANHGYPNVRAFVNPDGKTAADLGSLWTDGSRQYVLFAIDGTGRLVFGGDHTLSSGLVVSANVPSATLSHVSGATHTADVSPTGSAATQLEPSVGNVSVTLWADGAPVTEDGTVRAQQVQVRESYEVLDYADLYDKASANVGTPYTNLDIAGCVMIENTFTFTASGRCQIDTAYTELAATLLNNTLMFTQMVPMEGTVTRYMAGVAPIGGFDFTQGVDLSTYSTTNYVTTSSLLDPAVPPSFILDVRSVSGTPVLGFAHGYLPFADADTDNAARLAASGSRLWDLRSTKKSYPSAKMNTPSGWGRITGRSFRAYLTPAQAAKVIGHRSALAAFAALDAAAALT